MFCSKCGKEIRGDVQFCQFCGNKIMESERDDRLGVKIIPTGEAKNSSKKAENSPKTMDEKKTQKRSLFAVIFGYKMYLSIVAVLTIVALVLGKMIPKSTSSNVKGIDGELSRFIDFTEDEFLKETGLTKNTDGAYPSVNDMVVYFDNGKVSTVTLNKYTKEKYENCTLFGIKLGDILGDVHDQLSKFEYLDTQEGNSGSQNKTDMYKVSSDDSILSISYATSDHAILSLTYVSGSLNTDRGLETNTEAETNNQQVRQEDATNYEPPKTETQAAYAPSEYESNRYNGFILPYSNEYELYEEDLAGLSAKELTYARNEIYARHGYVFKSDELNRYFRSTSWYTPDSNFDGKLYGVELQNARLISEYQEKNGMKYTPK